MILEAKGDTFDANIVQQITAQMHTNDVIVMSVTLIILWL